MKTELLIRHSGGIITTTRWRAEKNILGGWSFILEPTRALLALARDQVTVEVAGEYYAVIKSETGKVVLV